MHKHGASIQKPQFFESWKFLSSLFVNPFTRMHDERPTVGGGCARLAKVTAKSQRMAPPVFLDYSNWEIRPSQFRPKRIVVADSGYSTKKVSNAAPPKTNLFRHSSMFCDYIWEFAVYVFSPVDITPIRRTP
jgi:hypothetical protein